MNLLYRADLVAEICSWCSSTCDEGVTLIGTIFSTLLGVRLVQVLMRLLGAVPGAHLHSEGAKQSQVQ